MKKIIGFIVFLYLTLIFAPIINVKAEELVPSLELSNGSSVSKLTDDSHYTVVKFNENDTITVKSSDGSLIHGLYISWDNPIDEWSLITDNEELICGKNGFLHEYIKLDEPSNQLIINIPNDSISIDEIRIFGEGELPHDVQVWNPPCEKADIMVVSSHSDDEILFFGGALTLYAYEYDADIQVVYMCEFRSTGQKVREHEKLDGLWEAGIRNYPTCGNFYDKYSEELDKAKSQYDYDEMVEFLVSEIRRVKPQVLVTHDIYGEYGHGFHKLTCHAVLEAVELAAIEEQYMEINYDIWNTPKTYLHISDINPIKLDLRVTVEEDYEGRMVIDILKAAYKKHVSQQGYWFYVSDDYKYSCAEFGLVRSLVGADTTNDLLCNLKTYKVQAIEEKEKLEEERQIKEEAEKLAKLEAERLAEEERIKEEQEKKLVEEEAIKKAEEENKKKLEEIVRLEEKRLQDEEIFRLKNEVEILKETEKQAKENLVNLQNELDKINNMNIFLIVGSIILSIGLVSTLVFKLKK